MFVFGESVNALLDSSCTRSIVSPAIVKNQKLTEAEQSVMMMNGDSEI